MTIISAIGRRLGTFLPVIKGPWGERKSDDGGSDGGGSGGDGGPPNPWTRPPNGKKFRGSKTSSVFDQLSDKMRGGTGGSGGGSGSGGTGGGGFGAPSWPVVRLFLISVAGLWLLFTSIWRIAPEEQGVVTTFGAYTRTLEPGIGLTMPWPFERVIKINTSSIRTMSVPEQGGTKFMLTRDQNILDIDYTVQWSISDPQLFQFEIADPERTVRDVADSAMRAAVANYNFSEAVSIKRGQIEAEASDRMRKILGAYKSGVRIVSVAVKAADPPKEVNEAFKDVAVAEQEAQAALNDANTYKQTVIQRAQGGAASFDAVYEQYKLAPGVTKSRLYYETMEDVLSKVDKVIVETPGVSTFLPLPELRKRLAEPKVSAPVVLPAPAADEKAVASQTLTVSGEAK